MTLLHLLAPHIMVLGLAPVVVRARPDATPATTSVTVTVMRLQWAVAAVTATFVVSHRRHLMVWAIFAPKLAFEALLAGAVTVVGALPLLRHGGTSGCRRSTKSKSGE